MKKIISLLYLEVSKLYLWLSKNAKIIIIWLILLATSILFINVLSEYIVKYLSVSNNDFLNISTYFNLVFVFLLFITLFRFIWLFIIDYSFSKYWGFWIFYISILYLILRKNKSDNLEFIVFYKQFYYSDYILFLSILSILLIIRNLFINLNLNISFLNDWFNINIEEIRESIYKEDIPLKGDNVIKNESVVDVVINNIKGFYPNKAFIIAINSEWGQGKTTFLKRVDYKLKESQKKPITFWFNVWQHQKEESIIQNFLSLLKKELSKYDGNANLYVNEYLNEILSIKDNSITKGIKFFSKNLLSNNSSLSSSYKDLNEVIKKINRQIIVFVDDLDRLNLSEINESLRVLRSVGNFMNIIFICGVDKEYLKSEGKLSDNYLNKIFNLEINLPKNNSQYYLNELFQLINDTKKTILLDIEKEEIIKTIYSKDNKSFLDKFDNPISSIFISESEFIDMSDIYPNQNLDKKVNSAYLSPSYFFNSSRDVKRFYNQLITNKLLLKSFDNIYIYDYLLFQLLIFKNSWIIDSFSDKHINICFGGGEQILLHPKTFETLINKPKLDLVNQRVVKFIIEKLFSDKSLIKERGINQRRYLQFYIKNDVFNEQISRSELVKSFEEKTIKELIDKKINGFKHSNAYLNDIKIFLLKSENLIEKEDFLQILSLIKDETIKNINYQEIIYIIYNLEQKISKNEVMELFDNFIFNDIKNIYGSLILQLNLHYTNYKFDSPVFQQTNSLKGLKYLNSIYVKRKVITLFNSYLLQEEDYPKVSSKLIFCTKKYYNTTNFSLYYDEIIEPFKKYFSKIIFHLLNEIPPHNYKRWVLENYNIFASIFNNDDNKIIKDAEYWSKQTGHIKLDKKKFTEIGLKNFIIYLSDINKKTPKEISVKIKALIKEIDDFIEINNNGF